MPISPKGKPVLGRLPGRGSYDPLGDLEARKGSQVGRFTPRNAGTGKHIDIAKAGKNFAHGPSASSYGDSHTEGG